MNVRRKEHDCHQRKRYPNAALPDFRHSCIIHALSRQPSGCPLGLYQYDLQALLNNPREVFVLADYAEDFFYGTILTAQEIDLPRRSRIVPDGSFTMEAGLPPSGI